MVANDLISPNFPHLKPDTTIEEARELFTENCLCHMAVVGEERVEGILPAEIIMSLAPGKRGTVMDLRPDFVLATAAANLHALDVFEIVGRMELSALPVTDDNFSYMGTIATPELMSRISSLHSFSQHGGIIRLSMGSHDYNLSEISRIVESNNAKIILVYMDYMEAAETIKVTLKLNTVDIPRIIATFERFNYNVDFYSPSVDQNNELKDRYDLLMKMLDI